MVISVSIPTYIPGKPVMYQINVDPGNNIRPYEVYRRYNDFLTLAKDFEIEMGEPLAVQPPPKPGLWESVDFERRRSELELVLGALVRVPEFAESLAVGNFLEIFKHRKDVKSGTSTIDWVHTVTEISRLINEARSQTQSPAIRQRVVQAKTLVGHLQKHLNESPLGVGEKSRRQQQLNNFLFSIHPLEQKAGSAVANGSADLGLGRIRVAPEPRVLGETAETRKHNNRGLLQYQQQIMNEQDEAVEDIRIAVARQKELGLAINSELVKQNEMLDELDQDVHKVNARLNEARRKTTALNR